YRGYLRGLAAVAGGQSLSIFGPCGLLSAKLPDGFAYRGGSITALLKRQLLGKDRTEDTILRLDPGPRIVARQVREEGQAVAGFFDEAAGGGAEVGKPVLSL